MYLKIVPENDNVKKYYENHSTYNEGDSGLDLFFTESITILPHQTKLINLHIKCEAMDETNNEVSQSYYLYPRSSISKTPLRMANSVGIIDAGYRGNILVAVDNISDTSYTVHEGDRLFQICSPTLRPIHYELVNVLSETERGSGGFGSTNTQ
jgi:dUTP pyrophosphatase